MIIELAQSPYAWLLLPLAIICVTSGVVALINPFTINSGIVNFTTLLITTVSAVSICGVMIHTITIQENQIYQVMAVEHGINIDRENIENSFNVEDNKESLFTDNDGKHYIGQYLDDGQYEIQPITAEK